jgi:tetratricopeptide (TPR) repeat protein
MPGTPRFERWIEETRRRIQQNAQEAAGSLARGAEETGDLEAATVWADRALELGPYDETSLRHLLHLLDLTGNRAGALEAYRRFAARIDTELGAVASPETEKLIAAIRLRSQPSGVAPGAYTGSRPAAKDRAELAGVAAAATEREQIAGVSEETPEASAAATAEGPRPRFRRRTKVVGVAAASAVLGTLAILGRLTVFAPVSVPGEPARLTLESNRIAIIPFINQTGDSELDHLGNMATDWITLGLAETGLVRAVPVTGIEPPETVPGSGSAAAWARELAEANRAAIVVHGSYYQQGDSIAFQAQVTDVATGELRRAVGGVTVPVETPLEAVELLRRRTTGALATVLDPLLESWAGATNQPPSYEAYRLYAEGMEVFFRGQRGGGMRFRQAADYFHRAAALDSSFVVPLLWALYAHGNAGDRELQDSLARALDARRDGFTRWERALLDAHLASLRGDLRGEYRAYSRLVEMTPGAEWNYKLAGAASDLNRPGEAVALLSEVDPTQGWLAHWGLNWCVLAMSHHELGDHEQELREVRRGQRQLPHSLCLRFNEAAALGALGRVEPPVSRYDARIVRHLVDELLVHGHDALAREVIADHLSRYDPDRDSVVWTAAYWLEMAGRPEEAEERLEAEIGLGPHASPGPWLLAPTNLLALGDLGALVARRGDRKRAAELSSQLGRFEARWPIDRGAAAFQQARIEAALGNHAEAVRLLQRAFDSGHPVRVHHPSWFPQSFRDYEPLKEMVRPKG